MRPFAEASRLDFVKSEIGSLKPGGNRRAASSVAFFDVTGLVNLS
jgi:hypothetical protein